MEHNYTDCRTEIGITVGLIDAIISIARVLKPKLEMYKNDEAIVQALLDMHGDSDVLEIFKR